MYQKYANGRIRKKGLSSISVFCDIINCYLYGEYRYGNTKSIGIAKFVEKYGNPIISFNVYKNSKYFSKERVSVRYCAIYRKYDAIDRLFSLIKRAKNGHYFSVFDYDGKQIVDEKEKMICEFLKKNEIKGKVRFKNCHILYEELEDQRFSFPDFSGHTTHPELSVGIALRCINLLNLNELKIIFEKFKKLENEKSVLSKLIGELIELRKLSRERNLTMTAKKTKKENDLIKMERIEKTTNGIRKAVIDEINLIRDGKISVKRANAVARLANVAIDSIKLDIEAQFLTLQNDLALLPELPEKLNDEVQRAS